EERRFQRAHEATCKACADEAAVWRSLDGAALETVLDHGALEQVLLAARAPRVEDAPSSIRRASPTRRRTVAGIALGACALAAAIAVMARRPHAPPPLANFGESAPAPAVVSPETLAPGPSALAPDTETRIASGPSPTCRMISPGATACLGAGSEVT